MPTKQQSAGDGSEPVHPIFPKDAKLSDQLAHLHAKFENRPMRLGDMLDELGVHAPLLLIILIALPFTIPIPIPVSTPFGLAILIIALAMLRGHNPRFPQKIRNAQMPPKVHDKIVRFSKRVIKWLERWMRTDRASWVFATPIRERIHICGIILGAAYLLLPLPIPFTNFFPGCAVFLIACGLVGCDGLLVIVGHLMLALGVLFLIFLGGFATVAIESLKNWIVSLFS